MNNLMKKFIALSGVCVMTLSGAVNALAAEFIDMPDNWTTEALQNAVENGLLYGSEAADGSGMLISPDENITRAQMAAIIVRAFGASETTDISMYEDVDADKWYYEELSKAVAMNAFRGDGNKMNPDKNITFQECYTVISQVLQLHYIKNEDTTKLDKYSDKDEVAEWALPYAKAIADFEYWTGIDGDYTFTPTEYITRSQFAVLMNNVVETYIDEPGVYEYDETMGNIMIRSEGVTLSGVKIDGDLIIGDGVENDDIYATNSEVTNFVLLRGGDNFVMEGSTFNTIIMINPDISVTNAGSNSFKWIQGLYPTENKYYLQYFEMDSAPVEEKTEESEASGEAAAETTNE